MSTLSISFELPAIVVSQAGLDLDNLDQDVKRMFAIFLYEHKRISLGKACEISNMSHWEFFEMNKQLHIPIHYTEDDLADDMEKLSNV